MTGRWTVWPWWDWTGKPGASKKDITNKKRVFKVEFRH